GYSGGLIINASSGTLSLNNGGANVGVGITVPTEMLHIYKSSGTIINLLETGSGASAFVAKNNTLRGEFGVDSSSVFIQTTTAYPILLYTNNSERMRITSGGQIGIGTSNPFGLSSSLLAISGNGNTYNLVNIQDTVNQNNCAFLQCLNASGVGIGEIRRIGTTNAVAFNTTSDYRLKEDFREIKGLEKISAIKVYDFKWKDNEFRMDGVLAHELQEIIPFAVTGDKDEVNNDGSIKTQGVDYSKIVPVLVKAIQELSAKVSLLENK
ncbi:Intramolecular chaperone auto-processing domain containing protein, partial [uncultured Caudovirales phage]